MFGHAILIGDIVSSEFQPTMLKSRFQIRLPNLICNPWSLKLIKQLTNFKQFCSITFLTCVQYGNASNKVKNLFWVFKFEGFCSQLVGPKDLWKIQKIKNISSMEKHFSNSRCVRICSRKFLPHFKQSQKPDFHGLT